MKELLNSMISNVQNRSAIKNKSPLRSQRFNVFDIIFESGFQSIYRRPDFHESLTLRIDIALTTNRCLYLFTLAHNV
jgi:hypothetical protein